MIKRLTHLAEAKAKGAKASKPEDKHVHVVYSSGEWGNRQWQYRVYRLPPKKEKDIVGHLRNEPHHANLAKGGWHVETARVAERKDHDKTQKELNNLIIKHAGKDAEIRKKLTAIEKPKEPKKK